MSTIIFSLLMWQLLLPPGAWAEDIRDVKPPVDLPANLFLLIVVLTIGAILVGFLFVRFLSNRIRRARIDETSVLPSWDLALKRLEDLKQKNLPALGQIKEYYTLLSDIVRRYLEDRFSIRAPEMTTPEFLWHLRDARELTADHKRLLTDFLQSCDMVKFAKYGPTLREMEESFLSAKKLIEETVLVIATVADGKK